MHAIFICIILIIIKVLLQYILYDYVFVRAIFFVCVARYIASLTDCSTTAICSKAVGCNACRMESCNACRMESHLN
jgi:hypothetical protein